MTFDTLMIIKVYSISEFIKGAISHFEIFLDYNVLENFNTQNDKLLVFLQNEKFRLLLWF